MIEPGRDRTVELTKLNTGRTTDDFGTREFDEDRADDAVLLRLFGHLRWQPPDGDLPGVGSKLLDSDVLDVKTRSNEHLCDDKRVVPVDLGPQPIRRRDRPRKEIVPVARLDRPNCGRSKSYRSVKAKLISLLQHGAINRNEPAMSYIYTVLASMGDAQKFAAAGATWAGERLKSHGAMSSTASQIVMGGEMSGLAIVAFEFDSIDAAMSGQTAIYADADLVGLIQEAQVQVQRRNLFRVQAERGTRDGEFGSVLYMAGAPTDDATMEQNLDLNWGHIKHGANGMTWMQSVASGPAPFNATVATWTDSLDSLMAASASNFADPAVQKIMIENKAQVLGRVITRRLF